jgi:hypothetical protein
MERQMIMRIEKTENRKRLFKEGMNKFVQFNVSSGAVLKYLLNTHKL